LQLGNPWERWIFPTAIATTPPWAISRALPREIFRGDLRRGRTIAIDLPPGEERSIDRVDFDCRPMDGPRASVEIAADDGGYRDRYVRPEYPDYRVRPYDEPGYYDRTRDPDYYGRPPAWDRD
jgi:hypothetical protein